MRIAATGKALALASMVAGGAALSGCGKQLDYSRLKQDKSYLIDTLNITVRDLNKLDSSAAHLISGNASPCFDLNDTKRIVYGNFVDSVKRTKVFDSGKAVGKAIGEAAGRAFTLDSLKKAGKL